MHLNYLDEMKIVSLIMFFYTLLMITQLKNVPNL